MVDNSKKQKLDILLIVMLSISAPIWIGTVCLVFPGFIGQWWLFSYLPFYLFVANNFSGPIIMFLRIINWSEYNLEKKKNTLWILFITTCLNLILVGVVTLKILGVVFDQHYK